MSGLYPLAFILLILSIPNISMAQASNNTHQFAGGQVPCPNEDPNAQTSEEEQRLLRLQLELLLNEVIQARRIEGAELEDNTDDDRVRSYYDSALTSDNVEALTFFCPAAVGLQQEIAMSAEALEHQRALLKDMGFSWSDNPLGDSEYGREQGYEENRREIMAAFGQLSGINNDPARRQSCDNEAQRLGLGDPGASPLTLFANRNSLSAGSACAVFINEVVLGQNGENGAGDPTVNRANEN